jgi:multiple sugar transport system ATP-binding protein
MSFGMRLRKVPREKIESRVREAASILGIEHLLARKPKELSGGERQRVALGRAIVREPQVFLMDEPLSNIDAKLRVEMRAEIIKLQRRLGVTTFYVTHDQVEALSMGDRIVVMSKGKVQQIGTPKVLYNSPGNRFVAGFIGSPSMNFIRLQVTDKGTLSAGENFNVTLPKPLADAVRAKTLGEVILGVRPEHLRLGGNGEVENSIPGVVDVVEPQGSTTILQVNIGANTKVIAQVNEQWGRQAGERLQLSIPPQAIHLFDPTTDERVGEK